MITTSLVSFMTSLAMSLIQAQLSTDIPVETGGEPRIVQRLLYLVARKTIGQHIAVSLHVEMTFQAHML